MPPTVLTFPLITKIDLIETAPEIAKLPTRVSIEVQTSLGRGVLEMSLDAALELAAKVSMHAQARGFQ